MQSSPYFPQSNGHAEASVKAMKTLIKKTTDEGNVDSEKYLQGLMEWRNTPNETGSSPAEVVFGHSFRSPVPAHQKSFQTKWKEEKR